MKREITKKMLYFFIANNSSVFGKGGETLKKSDKVTSEKMLAFFILQNFIFVIFVWGKVAPRSPRLIN